MGNTETSMQYKAAAQRLDEVSKRLESQSSIMGNTETSVQYKAAAQRLDEASKRLESKQTNKNMRDIDNLKEFTASCRLLDEIGKILKAKQSDKPMNDIENLKQLTAAAQQLDEVAKMLKPTKSDKAVSGPKKGEPKVRSKRSALMRAMTPLTPDETKVLQSRVVEARDIHLRQPSTVLDATTSVALALTEAVCTSHPRGEAVVATALAKHGKFRSLVQKLSKEAALQRTAQDRQEIKTDRPRLISDLKGACPVHMFSYSSFGEFGMDKFVVAYVVFPRGDNKYAVAFGKGMAHAPLPKTFDLRALTHTAIERLAKCPGTFAFTVKADGPIAGFYKDVEHIIVNVHTTRGMRPGKTAESNIEDVKTEPVTEKDWTLFKSPFIAVPCTDMTKRSSNFAPNEQKTNTSLVALGIVDTVLPNHHVSYQDLMFRMAASYGQQFDPVCSDRLVNIVHQVVTNTLSTVYDLNDKHRDALVKMVSKRVAKQMCDILSVLAIQLIRYDNPVKTFMYAKDRFVKTTEDVDGLTLATKTKTRCRTVVAYIVNGDKVYFAKCTSINPKDRMPTTARTALRRLAVNPAVMEVKPDTKAEDLVAQLVKSQKRQGDRV